VLRTNGQWQKYSTDKILSASEDNSFLEWSLTEMESNGWVQIVME
jgi:hypothetical protein